jgi:hypothetical protein
MDWLHAAAGSSVKGGQGEEWKPSKGAATLAEEKEQWQKEVAGWCPNCKRDIRVGEVHQCTRRQILPRKRGVCLFDGGGGMSKAMQEVSTRSEASSVHQLASSVLSSVCGACTGRSRCHPSGRAR